MKVSLKSTAPGRICLFGEHQDYMNLPVIAGAINLGITVEGTVAPGDRIVLDLPDMGENLVFSFSDLAYRGPRDYLRSSVQVLVREGFLPHPFAVNATIRGTIPIQAGASSSSALITAWIAFLLYAAGNHQGAKDGLLIARLAFMAEVTEFGERGGMMDHLSSSVGGLLFIDFSQDPPTVFPLPLLQGHFILGDSGEPKPTLKTITRVRGNQEAALEAARPFFPPFTHISDLPPWEVLAPLVCDRIPEHLFPYLRAVIRNRDITLKARVLLSDRKPDPLGIAEQINKLRELMDRDLCLSTPRLDELMSAALQSGALAAKVNGSGEGGCMLAYCLEDQSERVMKALRAAGGTPHLLTLGPGVSVVPS